MPTCHYIPGPQGRLSATYWESTGGPAVCIAPPDPRFGGNMDATATHALASAFAKRGFGVLVPNYSGVGDSDGVFGGRDGNVVEGAMLDLGAAVDWLAGHHVGAPDLVLAGVGIGGYVALQISFRRGEVKHLLMASPLPNVFDHTPLSQRTAPVTIVHGASDAVCPADRVRRLVNNASRTAGPRINLCVVPGVDHCFSGESRGFLAGVAGKVADEMIRVAAC